MTINSRLSDFLFPIVVLDVLVFSVASNETDGFQRYLRSIEVYGFRKNLNVLGLGEPWRGGNMKSFGGGYKINLLKKALTDYRNDANRIVLFTDRLVYPNFARRIFRNAIHLLLSVTTSYFSVDCPRSLNDSWIPARESYSPRKDTAGRINPWRPIIRLSRGANDT